ncbi:DMT family transporter [Mycolicibacterium smegmatis]|uniref:DMT family transporter n=1 Tax=Mycolicibacterium smegmatis TaxID=1772 RepID=UPI0005D7A5DD|nr:DMT family transporter [Mycolicibacterium smegmatis]MDF1900224.1 DMT family transporter [Mycolicibacterium smegmatis]MDF1908570.1 DMT family transporter [Mycolicibacterium smegmatis]MDF1916115.1 DMT family transporter [Mycolicibacterium smegmatis]MDF1923401.1 DMT family transporter [Mycolicibacterium smegmatis]UAK55228.1 DMT family transporter [Mycolicibacterium smegmatis]
MAVSTNRLSSAITARPVVATAVGAIGISSSGLFVALSATSPGTASFYRCLFALPLLAPLAVAEWRGGGSPTAAQHGWAALAGVLFAADALLWTQAIYEVGVGLSAVLVNTQVVMVPLLARLIDHESLSARFVVLLPVVVLGTVLAGGVLESGVVGTAPVAGTAHSVLAALCYSIFLFLLRRGGPDRPLVQSYVTIMVSAAGAAVVGGVLWNGVTLSPGWDAAGWLMLTAINGQVLGWLLIALGSPSLRVEIGSAVLLLTPVAALVLGAVFLAQQPSLLQIIGSAMILACAYLVTTGRASR